MGTFTATVPDFSLISSWKIVLDKGGWVMSPSPSTASSDKTFDFTGIPAGSVINSATLTATMNSPETGAALRTVDGGSFSGSKAVLITAGGNNTFRFRFKANGTTSSPYGNRSSTLTFSNVTITVDYTPPGGGGGAPPSSTNIGGLAVTPLSITAGQTLSISIGPCDADLTRHVTIYRTDTGAYLSTIASGVGSAAASWGYGIPLSWCGIAPNDTQFSILIELYAQKPGGAWGGVAYQAVNVNVPDSVKPTIGTLSATRIPNGVNAAITGYVQNYSKVDLLMGDVAGAYGSSIVAYELTGGGFSAGNYTAAFGPFAQTGEIIITARVTDSRGRKGEKTAAITVLPYGAPGFSAPEAWRSAFDGAKDQKGTYARLKSGVSYSSLGGQNAVTLKGRVYPKGGVAPAWETMTPDTELILGGGALLFTRTYIAQIQVSDLLESRITEFIIPTKKTGFSIMAGMLGAAIGKVAEIPGIFDVFWPIYSEGNRVLTTIDCPKAINEVIMLLSTDNPEDLWPGTTWVQLAEGKFPVSAGATYTLGGTGGAPSVTLTVAQMPEHGHKAKSPTTGVDGGVKTGFDTWRTGGAFSSDYVIENTGGGQAHENRPPWIAVNMWRRTA